MQCIKSDYARRKTTVTLGRSDIKRFRLPKQSTQDIENNYYIDSIIDLPRVINGLL